MLAETWKKRMSKCEGLGFFIRYLYILVLSLILAAVIAPLWIKNDAVFHTSFELICIFTALIIFTVTWISYDETSKSNRIIGMGFLAVALLDLFHTYTFPYLNFFSNKYLDLSGKYWIVGRLTEALILLLGCSNVSLLRSKKTAVTVIILGSALVSSLLMYFPHIGPLLLNDQLGATKAKSFLEFVIIAFYLAAMFNIRKNIFDKEMSNYRYLFISMIFAVSTEFIFAFYTYIDSFYIVLGHVFKLINYYFLFRAIFITGLIGLYSKVKNVNNESEERFKGAFDYVNTGVAIVALDGKWLRVNNAMQVMFGYPKEELVTMTFQDITYNEDLDKSLQVLKDLNEGNISKCKFEKRFVCKNKEVIWVETNASLVFDNFGKPLYFVTQYEDITEHKIMDELKIQFDKNQQLLKDTIELERLKTEFFANMSHEFKTPLNVILSSMQLLDLYTSKNESVDNQVLVKQSRIVRQNCRRLLRLVNNLIDATKLDSGYFNLYFQNHDIVSAVKELTLSVSEYIESSGISVAFESNLKRKMLAIDIDAIERILLNLLSNAVKFTRKGGSIVVSVYNKEECVCISVKDTGIGIPKDKQQIIFERFIQVDQLLTRKHEGSGIGLSLVKSLAELHQGKVYLNSEYGKGSEFIIELPARTVDNMDENKEHMPRNEYKEKVNIEFSDVYIVS